MSPNEREQTGRGRNKRQGRRPADRPKTEPVPLKLVMLEDRLTPNTGVQPPPGGLSGFVYVDANDNGVKEAGETPISGVSVSLVRVVAGVTTAVATTVTASDGAYSFINLPAGSGYRVIQTQPTLYADGQEQIGSTGGNKATNDQLDGIVVPSSAVSVNNNFGELVGGLSGFVYVDANDNGVKEAGEAPIPGTTVALRQVVGGVTNTLATTVTAADGSYSFNLLFMGGGYQVVETQPAGFTDGKDTPGAVGGGVSTVNDQIQTITLATAARFSPNNNFGELNTPVPLPPGALSGFVYEDPNNNGIKDAGEAGIGATTVTLIRVVAGVTTTIGTTTTAADGSYSFTNLDPGLGYRVLEAQPAAFLDGKDTTGSTGGTKTVNDRLDDIAVPTGGVSENNNFGELRPAQLSGFVYLDSDDDGVKDAGEAPIPGTTVTLTGTDDLGAVNRVATTAADGSYAFTGLRPGSYNVTETQPAGFLDGKDTIGTINGLPSTGTTANDAFSAIVLAGGQNSPNNNFGERPVPVPVPPGSLSGFVYVDSDDDGVKDAGEAGIGSTTVTLIRVVGGVTTTVGSTTTGADGSYSFTNLDPGSGYRVIETQPAGYTDGKDTPGSTGGSAAVNDQLDGITVPSNGTSVNNNFGELVPVIPPPPPGSLSGFVYEDPNNNGIKEVGEPALGGVTVVLYRPGTAPGTLEAVATATTAADGSYSFTNLAAGLYWVRESQPAGFLDGKDTVGNAGGLLQVNDFISAIPVTAGQNSPNNNFGELRPGSVSGFVYVDANDNGVKEAGETALGGVIVTLYKPGSTPGTLEVVATTTTAADGSYRFTDLLPGQYWVRETQPTGFLDGKDTVGSTGGLLQVNDFISAVTVPYNAESVNNNFGELVPPGSLSGFVYQDYTTFGAANTNNGVKDAGEAGIGGVTVVLYRPGATPGTVEAVATTTTAADGSYSFANLAPGQYWVRETQPADYLDGKDTIGTAGGLVQVNDWLSAIPVAAGQNSPNNNFGELIQSVIVSPPPPNPQNPDPNVSKVNFLGSSR